MVNQYAILEENPVLNPTNLAANTTEEVISGTNNVDVYNYLLVTNLDAVDIEVYLNNDTNNKYFVPKRNAVEIPSEDGKIFTHLTQKNLDAATAETAGKIQFKAQKRVAVA